MIARLLLLLCCFFISNTIVASDEIAFSESLASTEGLTDTLVGGHVCPISGDFVDSQIDLFVPGPEDLCVKRSYCSSDRCMGHLGIGWQLFEPDLLVTKTNNNKPVLARAKTANGALVQYANQNPKDKKYDFELVKSRGYTNCGSGRISAKTNLKNTLLTIKKNKQWSAEVKDSSGKEKTYTPPDAYEIGWVFKNQEIFSQHNTYKFFHYLNDGFIAYLGNRKADKTYGTLEYKNKDKSNFTVKSSNGKETTFKTKKFEIPDDKVHSKQMFLVKEVFSKHKPKLTYEHTKASDKHPMISSIASEDRTLVKVAYYTKGKNEVGDREVESTRSTDRVKYLTRPLGTNGEDVITHRFFYYFNQGPNRIQFTEVRDANNNRTDYHYNKDDRLEYILRYHEGQPYIRETYSWGPNGTVDEGNLAAKYVQREGFPFAYGKVFFYDKKGNITHLRDYSFVNGFDVPELSISGDGKPHDSNKTPYYQKNYVYNDSDLLQEEYEDNGKRILYTYHPDTDLVASKILMYGDNQILLREYLDYDENLFLYRKVTDDGKTLDRHNHTGITTMRVTYLKPLMKAPFGYPEQIDEKYYDCATGKEHLLHRAINLYQDDGQLVKQEHYDSEQNFLYALKWKFNDHGLPIEEVNALGHEITKEYDKWDQLIKVTDISGKFYTTFEYDGGRRLIKQIEHHPDGQFVTRFGYDGAGNKTSITDPQGNETRFDYNDLNQLEAVHHPDGTSERFEYNIFGQKISITNRSGYTTQTTCNPAGSPLSIQHPDGTSESFEYYPEGTLKKHVDRNNSYTTYYRDCMGRVLEEKAFDAQHNLLAVKTYHKSSFNLLREVDPEGNITSYEYDPAGRLIKKKSGNLTLTFEYDTRSRIAKEIQWITPDQARVTVRNYDNLNRIIEERVEDLQGTIYSTLSYAYNKAGEKYLIKTGSSETRTYFNSHNQPVRIIDAEGNETRLEYDYFYRNEQGETVQAVTTIDPVGAKILIVKDLNGHISLEKKFNAFGKLLAQAQFKNAPTGERVEATYYRIVNGQASGQSTTLWQYNNNQQLCALTEAAGSNQQRTRRYEYNRFGERSAIVKPDGTTLHYDFDSNGRVSRFHTSDNSIDYQYSYDRNNRVIRVQDAINNTISTCEYEYQHLKAETLGNGLTLSYTYDNLDRKTHVSLPDHSSIDYTHDALFLRSVSRNGYTHTYQEYDQNCNLTKAHLPKYAGNLSYSYDNLNRVTSITHPHYNQLLKDGYDQVGNLISYTLNGENYKYAYDDLQQLIEENNHTYAYDSLNNRLKKDDVITEVDALNQIDDPDYEYDLNGNLLECPAGTFTYDALNRLLTSSTPQGICTYTYDYQDRRLTKNNLRYLYDGDNQIGVYDGDQLIALRVLGDPKNGENGASIALEFGDDLFIPIHNHNGSLVRLLNPDGSLHKSYEYTAFGEELNPDPSDPNPWRFSSKCYDPETGLVYFGRRYYSPSLGRWLTPDPIDYDDGPNIYAYVHNRLLTNIDVYGLTTYNNLKGDRWNGSISEEGYPFDDRFETEHGGHQSSNFILNVAENIITGIGFINGVWNTIEGHCETVDYLTDLVGEKVNSVYNPSNGYFTDIYECYLGLIGIRTPPVRHLHATWDNFFENSPSDAVYLQICHSQGAIHVRNALEDYPPELRKRIIVLAIAPAAYIDPDLCKQVKHYRAAWYRDFIPRLNFWRENKAKDTIYTLESHQDASFMDHEFQSMTYRQVIKDSIEIFTKTGRQRI